MMAVTCTGMAVSLLPTSVGNERSSGVDRFQGITSRWLPRASTSCAGSSRKVPLHAEARTVLAAWLGDRARLLEELAARGRPAAPAEQAALWLSRRGRRLTTRAIELVVRTLGAEAGLEEELSAHVLHQPAPRRGRPGQDRRLAGHARLDTTRRYTLPSEADRQAAIDSIRIED